MPTSRLSDAAFDTSKKRYAELGVSELRSLKMLEDESARLGRIGADLMLDKHDPAGGRTKAAALIQRCQEAQAAQRDRASARGTARQCGPAMRDAWDGANAELAKKQLLRPANSRHAQHADAAASRREWLEEMLTVQQLGVTGALHRTLRTTNPIENLNGSVAHLTRNVKRWKDGQMPLRRMAGALSDAMGRFRTRRGYREMNFLLAARKPDVIATTKAERKARVASSNRSRHPAAFNNDRDIAHQSDAHGYRSFLSQIARLARPV